MKDFGKHSGLLRGLSRQLLTERLGGVGISIKITETDSDASTMKKIDDTLMRNSMNKFKELQAELIKSLL
jgi:hypothetical protein